HGFRKKAETRSPWRRLGSSVGRAPGSLEGSPRADPSALLDGLGSIRIVEIEKTRLREEVGGAQARGMIGIAFDLDRPSHDALDEEADPAFPLGHGGGEREGPSRNNS